MKNLRELVYKIRGSICGKMSNIYLSLDYSKFNHVKNMRDNIDFLRPIFLITRIMNRTK